MRIIAAGGDPNVEKLCTGCRQLLAKHNFSKSSGRLDGLQKQCKSCNKAARLK
jgi:hypothetical protein